MNPGLLVKLRPSGPWRIGPDSGARNRVDAIYHSDSLYSAVTSVMALMGSLDAWLDATARGAASAVCFSSCFPFLDEIGFVVPPRSVWPPASAGLQSARVRWKSARFVPLGLVQSILAGERLDENQWAVDGLSECLVPAGRPGPFRTSVRWNAAVDRLTGATERHATACLEFRPGAGLWAAASFANEEASERWSNPLKAAFRLLADTGLGGERSRGWGRSEAPEFVEGVLPDMILGPVAREKAEVRAPVAAVPLRAEPEKERPPIDEPPQEQPPVTEPPVEPETPAPEPVLDLLPIPEPPEQEPLIEPGDQDEPAPGAAAPEGSAEADQPALALEEASDAPPAPENTPGPIEGPSEAAAPETLPVPDEPVLASQDAAPAEPAPEATSATVEPPSAPATPETLPAAHESLLAPEEAAFAGPAPDVTSEANEPAAPPAMRDPVPEPEGRIPEAEPAAPVSPASEPLPEPQEGPPAGGAEPAPEEPRIAEASHPHWLLSLFSPAPSDTVDWGRGNYSILARGGRIESPAGSGELKKQVHMVAEGSVLYAASVPRGAAPDVAPDGFAHPVFRAGFAFSIPLPEAG